MRVSRVLLVGAMLWSAGLSGAAWSQSSGTGSTGGMFNSGGSTFSGSGSSSRSGSYSGGGGAADLQIQTQFQIQRSGGFVGTDTRDLNTRMLGGTGGGASDRNSGLGGSGLTSNGTSTGGSGGGFSSGGMSGGRMSGSGMSGGGLGGSYNSSSRLGGSSYNSSYGGGSSYSTGYGGMSGYSTSSRGSGSYNSGAGRSSGYSQSSRGGYGGSGGYGSSYGGMSGASSTGRIRTHIVTTWADVAPRPQVSAPVAIAKTQQLLQQRGMPTVRAAMRGEVAVLTGTVATTRDRALAEQLLRLEPGVTEVQNDLAVAAPSASAGSP